MDYDRNHFLTDIFEEAWALEKERRSTTPTRSINDAIESVIEAHVEDLRRVAKQHEKDLAAMLIEKRANPKELVRTRWANATNYDRRR
jgi:hypothetical protein